MNSVEDIQQSLKIARTLFPRLQKIYRMLPETRCRCSRPGECCRFMPEVTALEALAWIERIREMSEPCRSRTVRRFAAFYLTHPLGRGGCPFLETGSCSVYSDRPFACRAYGLWSPRMGAARTGKSRLANRQMRREWERFGVRLPVGETAAEIDYCRKVTCVAEPPVSDEILLALLGRIVALGQPLGGLEARFAGQYGSDISFLLTALSVGYRKAVLGKFAVIKEMARFGTRRRLRRILDGVDGI